ncbi:MAG: VanW family protein [Anaerolineae bacterium]|nr:VanW family protein [Anaerolineae bacterium]
MQNPRLNPWLIRIPLLFITGTILFVAILIGFVGVVQARYGNTIVPGVWAAGLDLSGMNRDEAASALQNWFTYDDSAIFTFRYGEQWWQWPASDLGVTLDVDATVEAAMSAGRDPNALMNIVKQASVWFNGRAISPVIRYDQNVATERLLAIADEVNRPPVDATLTINGLFVETTPAQTGWTLDVPATLRELDTIIMRMDTGAEIQLNVSETAPLITDTEDAARKARAAISGPITLVADSPDGTPLGPWTATPRDIASLIYTEPVYNDDGTVRYEVLLKADAFRNFLENLAPGLTTEARDGRFHFNEDTRQLEVFESAVNGRTMNVDETLARIESAVFNPDLNAKQVPVAFNYLLPTFNNNITATELGITELISEGTTYYTGSTQSRIANIAEAAQRFDGLIIAPGEEFSFNSLLGDINPEDGFVEGFVIIGGRTVRGVGGGVCQVSTTAYQAAFYAGFPILERYAHGYRVGYYEKGEGAGMDAAIYQGEGSERSLDLRFLNDTNYHLLIETSMYPGEDAVQFRFYSTNPGRQVVKEGPVIQNVIPAKATVYEANSEIPPGQERWVDWPAEGAYVVVTREILDTNGQEIRRDEFKTQYQPWGAVVQVAPGDARLNSTSS